MNYKLTRHLQDFTTHVERCGMIPHFSTVLHIVCGEKLFIKQIRLPSFN